MHLPDPLEKLAQHLAKLPGIGLKTARRHAMAMAFWEKTAVEGMSRAIEGLSAIEICHECGALCESTPCSLCQCPRRRAAKVICVVENYSDALAIEDSGAYRGLYHILGGVLNPLMGIGPGELNLTKLRQRACDLAAESILLAINPSVEGNVTCSYLRELLPPSVKLERIGFGIPVGGGLEFLDPATIDQAITHRRAFQ